MFGNLACLSRSSQFDDGSGLHMFEAGLLARDVGEIGGDNRISVDVLVIQKEKRANKRKVLAALLAGSSGSDDDDATTLGSF